MNLVYGNFEWDQADIAADSATADFAVRRAIRIFDRPHLRLPLVGGGEKRFLALGQIDKRVVELVYTPRNGRIRLLSLALRATIDADTPQKVAVGDACARRGRPASDTRPDWSRAELVTPRKRRSVSLPLDEDVIDYFKAPGPGYQRRINAALRGHMMRRPRAS